MADNWAVVIGVNEYRTPEHRLKGAVNDAVQMSTWLLDHGGVDRHQLYLHLSTTEAVKAPVRVRRAERSNLVDTMEELLGRSGGEGDRFYFYFAGHGLSSAVSHQLQSAILPSDFRTIEPDRSITVASLVSLLASTGFKEQYFFIDACRNLSFDTDAVLGVYPKPRFARTPPCPQFVMYATQPGVKATEIHNPNDEHGAFTRALLDGLGGRGTAKSWIEDSGEYAVRWLSLFAYVEARVAAMKLSVGRGTEPSIIQVPQVFGERGSLNPVFRRLDETAVQPETLSICLLPEAARPLASLAISNLSAPVQTVSPMTGSTAEIPLMPRTYGLLPTAPGYRFSQRIKTLEFYEATTVNLQMLPQGGGPAQPPAMIGEGSGPHVFYTATRGPIPESFAFTGSGVHSGSLTLRAPDPMTWLEVTSAAGDRVGHGAGQLEMHALPAGFYRASLLAPDGVRSEQMLEVVPGSHAFLSLLPAAAQPAPGTAHALALAGIPTTEDGVLHPSEAIGSASFMKLSSLLALAAGAATDPDQRWGHKLRQLGLPRFDANSGVYLVLGDELADPEPLGEGASMLCVPAGEAPHDSAWGIPLALMPAFKGIGLATAPRQPGPHALRLELSSGQTMTMPVAIMPGWLALVIVTRESDRSLELHHYQVPLLDFEDLHSRRPDATAFATLRRAELMQRLVQAGRLEPLEPDINLLLWDKWRDPIAGCLGAYLLLAKGRLDDLAVPAGNLVRFFGTLPDTHLLMALSHEHRRDKEAAIRSLETCLGKGLPVFRAGLEALLAAADRLSIDPGRTGLARRWLAHVPAGSLFSTEWVTSMSWRSGNDRWP
ncbi:caspase family protein [Paucibacter sp. R3-3]|uniref:Caspase family protein n=1 Tax=Roseateles agri TaxID=3098619 RepID=A0ABU5DT60_9BURK|nr:caspase family protein [Paucibacter sp. R3-3]MDY0748995.1 caspase family protein [Paucibacter sp. R3-3]